MYQDILAALFNGTVTMGGLRDVMEVHQKMRALGVTLNTTTANGEKEPTLSEKAAAKAANYGWKVKQPTAHNLEVFKGKNPAQVDTHGWSNKITLIKRMREEFGIGLADSKECCEALYGIPPF